MLSRRDMWLLQGHGFTIVGHGVGTLRRGNKKKNLIGIWMWKWKYLVMSSSTTETQMDVSTSLLLASSSQVLLISLDLPLRQYQTAAHNLKIFFIHGWKTPLHPLYIYGRNFSLDRYRWGNRGRGQS